MAERFVLLGLARARAGWFQTVGHWSTSAVIPAEFVRCVSIGELRARLDSGRPFSAALVSADAPGLDRDLVAEADAAGCAVIVVDNGDGRDWRSLGAAAALTVPFSRDDLLEVLAAHVRPVHDDPPSDPPRTHPGGPVVGRLVAVTGPGGTGASTVAVAVAQGLARSQAPARNGRQRRRGSPAPAPSVLLADLCRCADQAMLHDARVVVPGLQEVVEAHRGGAPPPAALLDQTFEVPARGYRLLLGLRRPRHWTVLRERAVEATVDGLLRAARIVVADVESDVEGESETGSRDVADRNVLARTALRRADVVVAVGEPTMKGLHALVRTATELVEFGIEVARITPMLTRGPRSPRRRAELTRTLHQLVAAGTDAATAAELATPTFLPERRVDEALRDGIELPAPLPELAAGAVRAVLDRTEPAPAPAPDEPEPVVPGSLFPFSTQPDDP